MLTESVLLNIALLKYCFNSYFAESSFGIFILATFFLIDPSKKSHRSSWSFFNIRVWRKGWSSKTSWSNRKCYSWLISMVIDSSTFGTYICIVVLPFSLHSVNKMNWFEIMIMGQYSMLVQNYYITQKELLSVKYEIGCPDLVFQIWKIWKTLGKIIIREDILYKMDV